MKTSRKHTRIGRNSSGRITVYHRGGGCKRLLRIIDWGRTHAHLQSNAFTETSTPSNTLLLNANESTLARKDGIVHTIQYDPNRSAPLALVRWPTHTQQTSVFSSILASDGMAPSTVLTHKTVCVAFHSIPIGTVVHNIEIRPGRGAQLVRSAGTFAQLIHKTERTCVIRLPSGVNKQISSNCRATIGSVANASHNTRPFTKAGQKRWCGIRPTVRGVAMNPIDHPHGGGEGRTKGGRPSVSPWGKPTKGSFRTRNRHKASA